MLLNKTILDLDTIYSTFSISETIEIYNELLEVKNDLEDVLDILMADSTEIEERYDEIMAIKKQLSITDINIKTLKTAIECHETKIFEKRNVRGKMEIICLN